MKATTTPSGPALGVRPRAGAGRAFTLVELLVVIAIVAILIGVLLPALAGAREAGYRSVSAGNLRSLATMMNIYANDNETEFPMIVGNFRTATGDPPGSAYLRTNNVPKSILAQRQAWYGGFAGFFSINQENAAPLAYKYVKPEFWSFDRGASRWKPFKYSTSEEAQERARLPLKAYIESTNDYQMLQNPADRLDGGENGSRTPAVQPRTIRDEKDVVWHNISYLYVAGLNQRTPQLGFLGDESNHCDIGNGVDATSVCGGETWGTLRKQRDDGQRPGYTDADNHGDAGGNFAYTDGHVEWITQRHGVKKENNPFALGFDPHDRIFAEIALFMKTTDTVETID